MIGLRTAKSHPAARWVLSIVAVQRQQAACTFDAHLQAKWSCTHSCCFRYLMRSYLLVHCSLLAHQHIHHHEHHQCSHFHARVCAGLQEEGIPSLLTCRTLGVQSKAMVVQQVGPAVNQPDKGVLLGVKQMLLIPKCKHFCSNKWEPLVLWLTAKQHPGNSCHRQGLAVKEAPRPGTWLAQNVWSQSSIPYVLQLYKH